MKKIIYCSLLLFIISITKLTAQIETDKYVKEAIKTNREKFHSYLIKSINENLKSDLTIKSEEDWETAFVAIELLTYKATWIEKRLQPVFDTLKKRSAHFQRAFLELVYSNYPNAFINEMGNFLKQTNDPKLFAMAAEYLFMNNKKEEFRQIITEKLLAINDSTANPFCQVVTEKLKPTNNTYPSIAELLNKTFLPNELLIFSFQRKNRNYPGMMMIRTKEGNFIKDEQGNYFTVPQLARSQSNLPGYLTNGNTPQGIFLFTGFGQSKSSFIGPTTNIQLQLPFEKTYSSNDSIADWLGNRYAELLPKSWKVHFPFYEAYFAGKAGRTEIIAHGTAVDPEYYKKQPYYPFTPTQGCLSTIELWSSIDGKRLFSDQQKLVNTLLKTGVTKGFCIVVEIDNEDKAVLLSDILPYLQ